MNANNRLTIFLPNSLSVLVNSMAFQERMVIAYQETPGSPFLFRGGNFLVEKIWALHSPTHLAENGFCMLWMHDVKFCGKSKASFSPERLQQDSVAFI